MGFLLSFNHSKYINYTYVLINKPLNHFTKIISLVMSELNLSNLVKALCLRNHKQVVYKPPPPHKMQKIS